MEPAVMIHVILWTEKNNFVLIRKKHIGDFGHSSIALYCDNVHIKQWKRRETVIYVSTHPVNIYWKRNMLTHVSQY